MATKTELEDKVVHLEKQLSEMIDAFRNKAQSQNSIIEALAKTRDDLSTLSTKLNKVTSQVENLEALSRSRV